MTDLSSFFLSKLKLYCRYVHGSYTYATCVLFFNVINYIARFQAWKRSIKKKLANDFINNHGIMVDFNLLSKWRTW